ncbi:DUF3168 domain-containing protein [Inquilinus sp.]|jgi:hypothetical protein|uniref:tail completion protein gp17 n=1 Tax=Inquilinus sp. TaxID=1932117 RepID=UPI003783CB51
MIEPALFALVTGNAGVAALIATRMYPEVLPQAPTYPAITYTVVTGESHYAMQAPSGLARIRVQFDLFTQRKADGVALEKAFMAAVSGFRGTVGSPPVQIQGAFRVMEVNAFQSDLDKAGPKVRRKTIDFEIWHRESYT